MKRYFIIDRLNESTASFFDKIEFNYYLDNLLERYQSSPIKHRVYYYNNGEVVVIRFWK